jgi:hypothetical protein
VELRNRQNDRSAAKTGESQIKTERKEEFK